MRIFIAQLNPTIGAIEKNVKKIIEFIEAARQQKSDIIVFPEMAVCGYPPEDLVLHETFVHEVEAALQKIVPHTKGMMAIVGMIRKNPSSVEKALLNTAAVIQDGKLCGFHDKWLLPTYDVFDERRYFEPGKETRVWEWKGKRIGVLICEDIWHHAGYVGYTHYPCDPVMEYLPKKLDVLFNLSSSPYQFQKPQVRIEVCEKTAKTLRCPLIMCCQVGGNDQLVFDGYSVVMDGQGRVCGLGKGFEQEGKLIELGSLKPIEVHFDEWGDLYQALVLGTRDYFHKQGFAKGVLGLSGGIDSSLVACVAVSALGKENVRGIGMPSRYSTPSSITDAKDLAANLGIEFDIIPIEGPFQSFLDLLTPVFEGRAPDVTEENLQARIRGIILMAISNKFGSLLLSTGNKSELAMGYCTLYGDMAGGLAVISDLTKRQVYALSSWINRQREIIPRSAIEKPPSAELKPNQKDTDTLPDYAILDRVVEAYVEEFLSPEEISKKYGIALELVRELVRKIHKAEYKRRQAPPGIRVSRKAFRVGRRYPIVQGWD